MSTQLVMSGRLRREYAIWDRIAYTHMRNRERRKASCRSPYDRIALQIAQRIELTERNGVGDDTYSIY